MLVKYIVYSLQGAKEYIFKKSLAMVLAIDNGLQPEITLVWDNVSNYIISENIVTVFMIC